MSVLYVVATPIGNLEDISLRALRILGEVKLIAAEDTRTARKLLNKYNIITRLTSYYEHNKKLKVPMLLEWLEENDLALISEAGSPCISDPGYELLKAAIDNNIKVEAIPGCSAVITALSMAGLPTDQFVYVGFLARKKGERELLLNSLNDEPRSIVCYESPYRIISSLNIILEIMGDRRIAVCREMTKFHEEVFRGMVSEAIEHFKHPRGEFTIVIEGKGKIKKSIRKARDKKLHGV